MPEPEWHPSTTLISKDPVVEGSRTNYLEYGPIRELKGETKLNDKPSHFCACVNCPNYPIKGNCFMCGEKYDLNLRIATVERSHGRKFSVYKKLSAFGTLIAKAKFLTVSAPANSNGHAIRAAAPSPLKIGRRKAISRCLRKALNHSKR
ncbi:uncharacterized protein PAC_13853 [Phialocephala subalpina]|uniref:Uncharacterized protein n=1 Tax=Phialocephala subalpina TaxID=576137 RepID=A0A1L7XG74_9HELO|nr:uncharacterized protein PAC_13853 [Phialocephala subalpina]